MKALFVELPVFSRHRADYLDEEDFRALQNELLDNPEKGEVIEGAGGLSAKEKGMLKDMLKRELEARR